MSKAIPTVKRLIYLIQAQKVMLYQDIVLLDAVGTRILVKTVRRNAHRFPEDFIFELTAQEAADLRSQIGISSSEHGPLY